MVLIHCCKCATPCLLSHVPVKQAIVEHIGMGQHGLSVGKISDELNFWLIGGLSHNLLFFAYKAMYYINLSTRQGNFSHGGMLMCCLVIWYMIPCLDGWVLVFLSNILLPSAK